MEQRIDIKTLVQDDHNFNKGTEAGRKLMEKSFTELGAGRSILVDKDGRIIAGNKSQQAAIAAGITTVRVIETTGDELIAVKRTDISLDSKEGRELALADNLTTQINLAWDEAELTSVAAQEGIDLPDWGLDPKELGIEEEKKEAQEDDFDEEKDQVDAICQKGDIWLLGEHRLMCGDSTKADDFERLMDGQKADIAFTSPPYNLMSGFHTHKGQSDGYLRGENAYNEYSDDRSDINYADFLSSVLNNCLNYSDDTFFNIGYTRGALIGTALFLGQNARRFCGAVTWVKSGCYMPFFPVQHGMLGNITEPVYIFSKDAARKLHHPTWKQGEVSYNIVETKSASGNEYSKEHAATFPIQFASEFIKRFSHKSVLDCFGGTGTTLIAAEQLGRKCFMMELDPHYCDVIIARWEKLTGQKAIKL